MTVEYIIVIGTDNTEADTPIARAMAGIGAAMDKKTRIFVTTPTGSCEFGQNKELTATVDCARRVLALVSGKNCRMLLFDASSIEGLCRPASGLLYWLSCYRALYDGAEPSYVDFDAIITEFLSAEMQDGIWWTGLEPPKGYTIQDLAKNRWDGFMGELSHDSINRRILQ